MVVVESLIPLQATGNRFVVLDAIAGEWPAQESVDEPSAGLARLVESACHDERLAPDGLLILAPATHRGADVRMIVYNRDGGRAESCGNGLRCVAKLARERGYVTNDSFTIETDAGLRRVAVQRHKGDSGEHVHYAQATLGVPQVLALNESLEIDGATLTVCRIDMGNPHCVVFVDDVDTLAVSELGPRIEDHPRFPQGTNVEFVARTEDGVAMRVWERGVGETASCGTGAAAVTVAALCTGRADAPLSIFTRGGVLNVTWEAPGEDVVVGGPVSELV